jgi:cytochrome c
LTEIASLYAGNANGIVTWALAPGKKRPDFPQMPSMAALGEAKLRAIAEYMLETGRKASGR